MRLLVISVLLINLFALQPATGQEVDQKILKVAHEILSQTRYCALITLDETGHPQTRTMEPFPPEEDFTLWFGTTKHSRKVKQIQHDSRATVYYFDDKNFGYAVFTGKAFIVDDQKEKQEKWMDHWADFYTDREKDYVLIKFVPDRLEVVSPKDGLTGDAVTWRAHSLSLKHE